ncbi:MAG: M48 family metalloprotease [Deltaproteobacteria bacterium]|nr:M48 family metalloprotease [Deltaproteobacteria bacterium]
MRTSMDLSRFFDSYPGAYATQAFFHSAIAGAVVEIALKSWKIRSPSSRQKFLLFAVVFPIFSFPIFKTIDSARNSVYFRMGALFDSSRWMSVELPGSIPLGAVLILVFFMTSLVFFFQELFPVMKHAFASGKPAPGEIREADEPAVAEALAPLPVEKPDIYVIDDEDPMIFSSTGRKGSVFMSSGLVGLLDVEQLQAALAHEIAHVARSRRPYMVIVFLLRIAMFFNPVVLLEFRRSIQDDEKICDEIAVSMTGKPLVLAATLKKLYLSQEEGRSGERQRDASVTGRLEDYSHKLNIESRIGRLEKGYAPDAGSDWFAFAAVFLAVAAINYYVV